jgi:hypothetical protein
MDDVDSVDVRQSTQRVIDNLDHMELTEVNLVLQKLVQVGVDELYHEADLAQVDV